MPTLTISSWLSKVLVNINLLYASWVLNFCIFWTIVFWDKLSLSLGGLFINVTLMIAGGLLLAKPSFLYYTGHPNRWIEGLFALTFCLGLLLSLMLFYELDYVGVR